MKQNIKILVVDDEEFIRKALQRVLESGGYDVITAADGNRALELVAEQKPELVLLDIKMPGKSGIEVLGDLRTSHPDTAVIMITAVADINVAVKVLTEGAYGYLNKPFNVNEVIIVVERALERRRLLLESREYHLNLERKIEEQTQGLRLKVRELTALNNLFVRYLNQGFEAADRYFRLSDEIMVTSEEIRKAMKQRSEGIEGMIGRLADNIIKKGEEIQALAKEAQALRVGVTTSPDKKTADTGQFGQGSSGF